jgi:CDP-6-deoxy-D-xylo-4-hexulose-3-dehydrase
VYNNIGYNLKPTDLQAAVGLAQMKKLPAFIAARKQHAAALFAGLRAYEDALLLPMSAPQADPSWFCFPITVREDAGFTRRDITGFLEQRGIETRLIFAGNILRQPAYQHVAVRAVGDMHGADAVMARTFFIGTYPGLTQAHLEYILETFAEFMSINWQHAGGQA